MISIAEKEKVLNQSDIPKGWIPTTWEDFLQISQAASNDKAKFYYFQGSYYSEIGVGADHVAPLPKGEGSKNFMGLSLPLLSGRGG